MGNRTQFKIRKQVEVSKDDYEWFLREHPEASLSWIVNILLQQYREVATSKIITVKDVATEAAARGIDEIESKPTNDR
jgi:hypothetical protein